MRTLVTFAYVVFGFLLPEPKAYVETLRSYDGAEYLDETYSAPICKAYEKSLAKLDWTKVQPGDVLAVNGVHVVAHLGEGQFIDSDPLQGGVAEASAETLAAKTGDVWFNGPAPVERWVK